MYIHFRSKPELYEKVMSMFMQCIVYIVRKLISHFANRFARHGLASLKVFKCIIAYHTLFSIFISPLLINYFAPTLYIYIFPILINVSYRAFLSSSMQCFCN